MRNSIAHDVSVGAIDRQKFLHIRREVLAELNVTLPTVKGRAPLPPPPVQPPPPPVQPPVQSLQTGDIVFGEVVGAPQWFFS